MANKMYYFYVLYCADDSLYTGYTVDLWQRTRTHNAGKGAKYTKCRLPVRLVYAEARATRAEAMSAEAAFKRLTRQKKEHYMRTQGLKSLFEEAPLIIESKELI